MLPKTTTPCKKKQKNINLQLILDTKDLLEIKCSLFFIYSAPFIPFNEPGTTYQGQYFDALVVIDNRDMKLSDPLGYQVDCTNYANFVDEDGVIWDVCGYAMYTYYDEKTYHEDWKYFLEKGTSGWTFHLRKRPQQEEQ